MELSLSDTHNMRNLHIFIYSYLLVTSNVG